MRKWIGVAAVWLGALALGASAPAASLVGLQPVPEPATILMVGAGLAGIAFLGRRRQA